jgi:hypothetical protein
MSLPHRWYWSVVETLGQVLEPQNRGSDWRNCIQQLLQRYDIIGTGDISHSTLPWSGNWGIAKKTLGNTDKMA